MISITLLIVLLVAHFVADFVMQTDRMAKGKSTSLLVLTEHVFCYAGTIFTLVWLYEMHIFTRHFTWQQYNYAVGLVMPWVLMNGVAHWCTDAITSRITSKLWKAGEVHWFFVVIGLDQLLHYIVLVVSAARMGL